jgi:hypothetical protein
LPKIEDIKTDLILSKLPKQYIDSIHVGGSLARGEKEPKDIDLIIRTKPNLPDEIHGKFANREYAKAIEELDPRYHVTFAGFVRKDVPTVKLWEAKLEKPKKTPKVIIPTEANTIQASDLKLNDRFLRKADNEVYVVTEINKDKGTVKVQDGKKRIFKLGSKITILGDVNQPEAVGIAGGIKHPRGEEWAAEYVEKILGRKARLPFEEPIEEKTIKDVIARTSGQIKVTELVREDVALTAALKKAEQAARKAYAAGKREGIEKTKTHLREVQTNIRARKVMREELKKMIKDLKAIDIEKMSPQQAEPVSNLLEGFDLVKRNKKAMLKLQRTREFMQANPEEAELPDYVLERLERLDKKNLNDISFDELKSIHTAVMHHVHLDKLKKKIKVAREWRRRQQVLEDSIGEMKPMKELKDEIISSQRGWQGRMMRKGELIKHTFGIRHDHYDLIVESLAGMNSTMDKVLYQGVKDGIIEQLQYRQNVYDTFQKDLGDTGFKVKDTAAWLNERVKVGRFDLTHGERMALYRHSLNNDNRKSIVEGGFGIRASETPDKVHKINEEELTEILDSLTKEEKLFAGKPVDNLFQRQYEALNKVFYEKNGYPLPKEEDYYPKEVMPIGRGREVEAENFLEKFRGKWTRVGIEKGMLEKRRRVKLPIYLDSIQRDINKSVMRSAAYVGLEIPMSNASKLLYDKRFKYELANRYDRQSWKEIEKGLRDIAGDWQSYTTVEELLLKAKNNLAVAALGINPFVMTKQVLSWMLYLPYVKPEYLIQGTMDSLHNLSEVKTRHKLYSPEFRERVEGGFSRDVADIFKASSERRLYGKENSIKERFMRGIRLFDEMAVIPGMQAAVLQVFDEFKAGKLSKDVGKALDLKDSDISKLDPKEKMKLAYKYADWVTERTQPMFSPEHRSSLSRGASIEKLATMFGSFTNQALNLIRRTWREAQRTKDPAAYKKVAQVLFLIFAVNTAAVMGIDEIRDRIYGRKKRLTKRTWYGRILDSWSGYMFFIRDIMRAAVSVMERGEFRGYDVEWPIGRLAEATKDAIGNGMGALTETKSSRKREKKAIHFIDNALSALLMSVGIPYETPKKIVIATYKKAKETQKTLKPKGGNLLKYAQPSKKTQNRLIEYGGTP